MIETPKIITEKKYGNFTLRVLAYRKLTDKEVDHALLTYMRQCKLKQIPTKGVCTVQSLIGAIDIF